jgi:hypothetical protein
VLLCPPDFFTAHEYLPCTEKPIPSLELKKFSCIYIFGDTVMFICGSNIYILEAVPYKLVSVTSWQVVGSILDEVIGFFSWPKSFQQQYGPGVDSAPNRNDYQEYSWG